MAARKQRKTPRASFIVTVATTAVAVTALPACDPWVTSNPPSPYGELCPIDEPSVGDACFSGGQSCSYSPDGCGETEYRCSESFKWEADAVLSCNPPPPQQCPEGVPESGSACAEPGVSCSYTPTEPCVESLSAICNDAFQWMIAETYYGACNPPPPCPADPPEQGAPCFGVTGSCSYTAETACGPMPVDAVCGPDGAWQVSSGSCDPPPADSCGKLATIEQCSADASCQWLVPGCGEAPLAAPGCHPVVQCAPESACSEGLTCQAVSVDPCWSSNCDACSQQVNLCLPPPAP